MRENRRPRRRPGRPPAAPHLAQPLLGLSVFIMVFMMLVWMIVFFARSTAVPVDPPIPLFFGSESHGALASNLRMIAILSAVALAVILVGSVLDRRMTRTATGAIVGAGFLVSCLFGTAANLRSQAPELDEATLSAPEVISGTWQGTLHSGGTIRIDLTTEKGVIRARIARTRGAGEPVTDEHEGRLLPPDIAVFRFDDDRVDSMRVSDDEMVYVERGIRHSLLRVTGVGDPLLGTIEAWENDEGTARLTRFGMSRLRVGLSLGIASANSPAMQARCSRIEDDRATFTLRRLPPQLRARGPRPRAGDRVVP